jgi:hypothetical protein
VSRCLDLLARRADLHVRNRLRLPSTPGGAACERGEIATARDAALSDPQP